jgi:hypothetical protein
MSAGIGWITNTLILHEPETLAILHSYAVTGPGSTPHIEEFLAPHADHRGCGQQSLWAAKVTRMRPKRHDAICESL